MTISVQVKGLPLDNMQKYKQVKELKTVQRKVYRLFVFFLIGEKDDYWYISGKFVRS